MKPHVIRNMVATREAVDKTFGPQIAEMFVANPTVVEYAVVLRYPDAKVIVGGEIRRALRKLGAQTGPMLVIARDLTVEARQIAADAGCDVLDHREFGWTDASYQSIRQHS